MRCWMPSWNMPGCRFILLDTPGHVDFSAEMERTLQILDYAILVISATDGVQGHTYTLWDLLRRHQVPAFLFVNKMDLPGLERAALLAQLRRELSPECMDFSDPDCIVSTTIASSVTPCWYSSRLIILSYAARISG